MSPPQSVLSPRYPDLWSAQAMRYCWRMFSSLPQRFQIPPRYARPPLQKGAFGSPPLAKEGQGGFRQQYRHACAFVARSHAAGDSGRSTASPAEGGSTAILLVNVLFITATVPNAPA